MLPSPPPMPTPEQALALRAAAGVDPPSQRQNPPAARAEGVAAGWIAADGTLTTRGTDAMRAFAESYGGKPAERTPPRPAPGIDWRAYWEGDE